MPCTGNVDGGHWAIFSINSDAHLEDATEFVNCPGSRFQVIYDRRYRHKPDIR